MTNIPLHQLTEWWSEQQRQHQAQMLALFIESMNAAGLSDEEQAPLIAAMRAELEERFEKQLAEIAALASRGLRTESETLH
jgi:hypothetical protein